MDRTSWVRPNLGSVAMLITGERPWLIPEARAWRALEAAMSRTSDTFHDEPCSAGIGKTVQPGCPPLCSVSPVKSMGIPRRLRRGGGGGGGRGRERERERGRENETNRCSCARKANSPHPYVQTGATMLTLALLFGIGIFFGAGRDASGGKKR